MTTSSETPVLLATVDRELNLPAGTAAAWAADTSSGFPLAGDGVARVSEVRAWMISQSGELSGMPDNSSEQSSSVGDTAADSAAAVSSDDDPLSASLVDTTHDDPKLAVEYVTIRIPVVRKSGTKLAARINQSYSLRSGDLHIREAMGDILEGCRLANTLLKDGTPVNNFSAVHRLLGELVSHQVNPRCIECHGQLDDDGDGSRCHHCCEAGAVVGGALSAS